MLSLLILWLLSALVFAFIGLPILHFCNLHAYLPKPEDRIFVAIWLGIIVLSNLLLLASLFVPLTLLITAELAALLAVPWISRHSQYALKGWSIDRIGGCGLVVALLFVLLFITRGQATVADTGMYHHQMINWLAEYGSVHGLALINMAFGYTDAWFALIAPLQTGWLRDHFITAMNGFVFLLMAAQSALILRRFFIPSHISGIADWFFILAFGLFCRYSFSVLIHSPSPDVPVTMLVLITAWLVINISSNNSAPSAASANARWGDAAVLILAAGAVSFKLGALPLLGAAMFYFLFAQGLSLRKSGYAVAVVAPFALTHLWVSVITSGCAVYPAPYMCTDLPWSMGSEDARSISAYIFEYLKWGGQPAPADASGFNWLWHKPLGKEDAFADKPLMFWLLLVNLPGIPLLYFSRNTIGKKTTLYMLLIAISGIVFTLVKLPHLRFGLGFFLLIPALSCAALILTLSQRRNEYVRYLHKLRMALLLIALYLAFAPIVTTYKTSQFSWGAADVVMKEIVTNASWLAIWPVKNINPVALQAIQGNDFVYYRPVKKNRRLTLCWGATLPCANKPLNNVWLRNEKAGFSEGFVKSKEGN